MSVGSAEINQKIYSDNYHASSNKVSVPSSSSRSPELPHLKVKHRATLRQFKDFPSPGVLFEVILPIFKDPSLHEASIKCLELHNIEIYGEQGKPEVIVGHDARGFLFGPLLALRLGATFVPVRKQGELPGSVETSAFKKEYGADFFQIQADAVATFVPVRKQRKLPSSVETSAFRKEYGADFFQIQADAVKPGQKVVVVDDIIATSGSASAAASLIQKLDGVLLGFLFILELNFLKAVRSCLRRPTRFYQPRRALTSEYHDC